MIAMARSRWPPRGPVAWGVFIVAVTLLSLAAYTELGHAARLASGADMDAYWNAALRLRHGEPLYAAGLPTDSDLYRYAPWFAYAWIPLTLLPKSAVLLTWMTLCVASALASTMPLLRRGAPGIAAFGLLLPFQLEGAAFGNVQPLLVLLLVWGVERRSGPLWIAIAASLKATPLLLVAVYLGRHQWRRAALTLGLTGALVAPMLAFDLRGYSTQIGGGQMSLLTVSPVVYALASGAAVGLALIAARSRYAWLAGIVAVLVALPRFLLYEISFVLVGLARPRGAQQIDR
ncbi:MAG: glycosyltransferase 87 family protein [Chloroflexota bacterium]|nr:glycosyltransferase 87 family protein [Chloroflexota bacterium]